MGDITAAIGAHFPMVTGNKGFTAGTAVFSSSYATSGESFTAATFGLGNIDHLSVTSAGGYTFEVDMANLKILAYNKDSELTVATDNVAHGTDALSVQGSMLQHVPAAATVTDAVAIVEVGSTDDISSITFRFEAYGTN